jgi:hypothetical protein
MLTLQLEFPRLEVQRRVLRATCHGSIDSCYLSVFQVDVNVYKMLFERTCFRVMSLKYIITR